MPTPTSDRTPRSRRSFRPRLTQLEDRSTPAAITTVGPTATIDLNGFSGGEAVSITTTAAGAITVASNQGVTLNGGASAASQTFSGATTVQVTDSTFNNSLTFGASTVAYAAAFAVVLDNSPTVTTFNGASAFGTNALSVTTTRNIAVNSGATVSTASGGITFSANQQATPTSGGFIGIDVQGDVTSGSGAVLLSGRGGDSKGGSQFGISVSGGGTVSTTGSGGVTLAGTGGVGGGQIDRGVYIIGTGSAVTSGGGNVIVTGTGGGTGTSGDDGSNEGVRVETGAQIAAGGAGTVTVQGTGGADGTGGIDGFNVGVTVIGTGAAITSGGGNVSVTGTGGGGGGGGSNSGVNVQGGGLITAGGTGTVAVQGTGGADSGAGNFGVLVTGINSAITSGGGGVSVTATGGGGGGGGGSNSGVNVQGGGQITAGGTGTVAVQGTGGADSGVGNFGVLVTGINSAITSGGGGVSVTATGGGGTTPVGVSVNSAGSLSSGGNAAITVTADSMRLQSITSVNAGTGTVNLRPRTAGTFIDLGGADVLTGSPLTLGLTDAELDSVTAGTLIIGRATAGNLTVTANVGPANDPLFALVTGGSIGGTGTVTATGLTLTAVSGIGAPGTPLSTAAGSITANNTGVGSITIDEADAVTLTGVTAANGAITITTGGATTVTSVVSTTDSDANDISIVASAGDITVATVSAGGTAGDVILLATTGNIFDDGVNGTLVIADVLTLSADRSIGAPGATAQIDTAANSLTAATTGAGPFGGAPTPGIWVADTNALTVTSATTQDGVILLDSGGTMTVGIVSAGGTGRNVRLQTSAGDIAFGTTGSVTAAGDAVRLIAAGSITEIGAAVKVTALSLSASAGTAIGTAGGPLNTTVTTLAAATGNGGIFVTNSGALVVASLTVFGATVNGVTATAGDVVLTTAAGDLTLTAPVSAVNNAITLNSDDVTNAASTVNAGTGTVTIRPVTAGRAIDLGTNTAGQLGLTDAELDLVTAGTLILGRSTAGNITLSADISRPAPTNVQLISGAAIGSTPIAGRIDTAGGTLIVQPNTDFVPNRFGTDVIASTVVFAFPTDLRIGINGTAVDVGYTQLNVTGSLNLGGVNLALSGSYVPVFGDSFTIASATALTGTFAGLPNGATVTFNGVALRIFYTATTATLRVNRAPTGVSPGGPYTIAEGAGLTVTAPAATDADGDALTYTWDVNGDGTFGDEAFGTVSNGGRTVTFTPAQLLPLGLRDGAFSTAALAVRVSDGLTFGTVTATGTLTVSNVAPTILVSGTGTANEGAVYTLTLGAVTDPGQDTVTQYRVNWGDGTSDTYTTAGAKPHTYVNDGVYTVTVDLTDEDGTFLNVGTAHTVTVSNVGPVVTPPATIPSPDEGATTTFALGSFTDPADVNDGPYTVQVTWGDGNSDTFTVLVPGSLGPLAHTYADNGFYTVTVMVSEAGGTFGTNSFPVTVNNVAPTPTISGPNAGAEGTALAFTATATDPAGVNDPIAFTWGVTKSGAAFAAGTGPAFTFTPDDDGTYVLSLTADDGDGGVTTVTRTVAVSNVAPTITSFVVPPGGVVGQPVAVSAAATDPAGVNDPLAFAWVVTLGGVTVASGAGAAFTFTPTAAGIYNVTVTVSDGDGGAVSATAGVTVTAVAPPPPVPPVFVAPPLVFSNAGRVRVVNPNGTTRDLNPFPGFLGDVTVASADLNGDGVPEVVVGAGAGGGPHVVVFDGATGAVTASFFAYDVGFTGGVYVAATADGRIITGAGAFGGPHVKVIDYARTGQKLPNGQIADSALVTTFFAYDAGFIGGVRVAAGDVTGDGVADIVTGAGPGGGPQVNVYDGVTYAAVRSFYAFAPDFANGVYVAAASGWLAAGAGTWGGPHVRVYDSAGSERFNFFAYDVGFIGGVRVAFADVDADGTPDVVTAPGLGGGRPVKATRLSDLTTVTSIAPFAPLDPLGVFVG